MKQTLKADRIVKTLEILHTRISERFPGAGLLGVCTDLITTARETSRRVERLRRPNYLLRLILFLVVAAGIAGLAYAVTAYELFNFTRRPDTLSLTQAIEAAANLLILTGAAIWYLVSLEERMKRASALSDLHELRSFAHVIDMHQLTKDPTMNRANVSRTKASPQRNMTDFELSRYLDYCSEMLALTSKLAALYGEETRDTKVIGTVNEIENLTTNLGRKIWQKIVMIGDTTMNGSGASGQS